MWISALSSSILNNGPLGTKWLFTLQITKEMVFHWPKPWNIVYPAPFDGIDRVQVDKFLGVFLQSNFSCEEQVKYILTVCSQRMYLLKCLKAKGLPIFKLHNICQAIIIFKIMYSIPAWGRFCQQNLKKNRIDGLLCHLHRYGYTPTLLCSRS